MALDLISRFQDHLREHDYSPRTVTTYARTLTVMHEQLPFGLDQANETEIRAWIWRDGLKPASRANYLAASRAFFSWAEKHAEVLTFDPTARLRSPKIGRRLPRVATDDQVREVLTRAHEPYRMWALIAAYAGLRCIEVYRLHREHVTQRHVTVWRGKGDTPRIVPTHPLIWAAVEAKPAGPLVTEVDDERVLSRAFGDHCRHHLHLTGMSMHRLRGWWATKAYRATRDIRAVQQGMGHASPAMTAGYIDVADSQLQAMVDGLPVFD